jgi:hypothetical protein
MNNKTTIINDDKTIFENGNEVATNNRVMK